MNCHVTILLDLPVAAMQLFSLRDVTPAPGPVTNIFPFVRHIISELQSGRDVFGKAGVGASIFSLRSGGTPRATEERGAWEGRVDVAYGWGVGENDPSAALATPLPLVVACHPDRPPRRSPRAVAAPHSP
jgi:hypothetical protein